MSMLLAACGSEIPPLAERPGQVSPSSSPGAIHPPQFPAPVDDFYGVPDGVPAAEPGRLVRTELLDAPGGVQGWRVLYHSTSVDGRDIVVSGLVFAPAGPAAGPRPVVAWGHGSVGLGDSCAPSRSPGDLIGSSILSELLRRGYVVAATDYEGLGTPGSHPWLVGQSEGRGVLDSVRAARQIPEASAGNRFLAFEPGRYVRFEIPSGWITGTASYRTEDNQSAGTVLTSRMEFRVRGPLSLLEPVLSRLLAKDSRRDEQRLKSLLEHRDPSALRKKGWA